MDTKLLSSHLALLSVTVISLLLFASAVDGFGYERQPTASPSAEVCFTPSASPSATLAPTATVIPTIHQEKVYIQEVLQIHPTPAPVPNTPPAMGRAAR